MKTLVTTGPVQPETTVTAGRTQGTTAAAVLLFAGFAGFGAGAVNLAAASSLLLSPAAGGFAVAGGVVEGIWGTSLLAWTVLSLRRGRLLRAGAATALLLGASLVHVASAVAAMAAGPSGLALSHLTALLLSLMIVAAAGWLKRRSDDALVDTEVAAQPRAGRLLLAAFASSVLVAGIATPGLAASTAGQYAVPHGEHGLPGVGSHHNH
ncbi:MAG: hypothetical protein NTU93_04605 [Arthrobacter sp.]|nr:hypothetical protein [Arthrobacter sp.]